MMFPHKSKDLEYILQILEEVESSHGKIHRNWSIATSVGGLDVKTWYLPAIHTTYTERHRDVISAVYNLSLVDGRPDYSEARVTLSVEDIARSLETPVTLAVVKEIRDALCFLSGITIDSESEDHIASGAILCNWEMALSGDDYRNATLLLTWAGRFFGIVSGDLS